MTKELKEGDTITPPDDLIVESIDQESQTAMCSWEEERIIDGVKKMCKFTCEIPLSELEPISVH